MGENFNKFGDFLVIHKKFYPLKQSFRNFTKNSIIMKMNTVSTRDIVPIDISFVQYEEKPTSAVIVSKP